MHAATSLRRSPLRILLLGVLVVAMVSTWPVSGSANAADPRLQRAQTQRTEVQQRLDGLIQRLDEVTAAVADTEAQLGNLRAQESAQQAQATAATGALAMRLRASYKRGIVDPTLTLFTSQSPQDAARQSRLLGLLALRSRSEFEGASAARIRTQVAADEVTRVAGELSAQQAQLDGLRRQVASELAKAQQEEQRVRTVLADEQAARDRAAKARAARAASSRPSRSAGGTGPVVGNVACPIGTPRSYSDSWGAPRSGGRRHKGTDIMSTRGTPIYAYESGSITRTNNSRVGGISIYLRGDSGNLYYYTHLQGYVSGLSAGQRVGVGQHIAFNGDTGNARGMPHLHFEVMPGGGGNVNPYPYVRRACG